MELHLPIIDTFSPFPPPPTLIFPLSQHMNRGDSDSESGLSKHTPDRSRLVAICLFILLLLIVAALLLFQQVYRHGVHPVEAYGVPAA
jgi:hypothetical protein